MPEPSPIRRLPPRRITLAAAVLCLAATAARAGLGGENVAVVVNADSTASMAVANEFIALRKIPPTNVVYLSLGTPTDAATITVEIFRDKILQPVLRELARRGLAGQIDCVAYSSDVPYAVRVEADVRDVELPRQATKTASINGMTYLYRFVLAKSPAYLSMKANRYARRPVTRREDDLKGRYAGAIAPTRGFRSLYAWGPEGQRVAAGEGPQYLLSIMLAVTSGRGNTVDEALAYLRRSAAADGTRPDGTIYYMVNGDIRTRTRQWGYRAAIDSLQAVGVAAELRRGLVPIARKDVMGLMTGTATFDWNAGGSRIRPGAICEHLTSNGGVMRSGGNQTPLSVFLRHGAAAASGTVTEPYAIAAKFPSPFVHYHYARGCTLIEAFYQSVPGPYQLLIVGDPLCRPWAVVPAVTLEGLRDNQEAAGDLKLTAGVAADPAVTVGGYEIFLDGRRIGTCGPEGRFRLGAGSVDEGYHELRVVAVAGGDLETRGVRIVPFFYGTTAQRPTLSAACDDPVTLGDPVVLSARLEGADRIDLHHNGRVVGSVAGAVGTARIDSERIGPGVVTIIPVASLPDAGGAGRTVRGRPIEVRIIAKSASTAPTEAHKTGGAARAKRETADR